MAALRFTKMHGLGNDYIYVECFSQILPGPPGVLAQRLSNRRTGVGADGLILIGPSTIANCKMEIYNADGSRAEMCGNGIRCVGKYVFDRHLVRQPTITVETDAGVRKLFVKATGGEASEITVDMGVPTLEAEKIPVNFTGQTGQVVERPLVVGDQHLFVTCVSMGNPHCVLFVDDVQHFPVAEVGPRLEHHLAFPRRINVEFVEVVGPSRLVMRVWERGSGETDACGTGACAALVAGVLTGRTHRRATVQLRGGPLAIAWDEESGHVYMTGPATEVYEGEIEARHLLSIPASGIQAGCS